MTAPRQVLPGTVYLVTRRCAQRQFLLAPSRSSTSALFLFVLAIAARRYGIDVHAFCVLSNHYHLVVTDRDARLPAFVQFLDALVARAVNASLGRWEAFWDPNSYSAVKLVTPEDIVDKCAYVLANPVAAGLVGAAEVWPGLWSSPDLMGGGSIEAKRPDIFFAADGALPDKAELVLTVPPGFTSADEFTNAVRRALAVRESEARAIWSARGGFLGLRRVLKEKPSARAVTAEPRRTLSPRIAARDGWKRMEALLRLRDFVTAYRVAWAAWRRGEHAIFPAGTYHLRVAHGVPCAAAG